MDELSFYFRFLEIAKYFIDTLQILLLLKFLGLICRYLNFVVPVLLFDLNYFNNLNG